MLSISAAASFLSASSFGFDETVVPLAGVAGFCGPAASPATTSELQTIVSRGFDVIDLLLRRDASAERGRGAPVIDPVEQELEGAVRLRAPGDLRPEEDQAALPDRRIDDLDRLVEILLTPRPAALERRGAVEPRDALHTLKRSLRLEAEGGAVIEEDHHAVVDTVGERMRRVDPRFEKRAWNVEFF